MSEHVETASAEREVKLEGIGCKRTVSYTHLTLPTKA